MHLVIRMSEGETKAVRVTPPPLNSQRYRRPGWLESPPGRQLCGAPFASYRCSLPRQQRSLRWPAPVDPSLVLAHVKGSAFATEPARA